MARVEQADGNAIHERGETIALIGLVMEFMSHVASRDESDHRHLAAFQRLANLVAAMFELRDGVVAPLLTPGPKQNRVHLPMQTLIARAWAAAAAYGLHLGGLTVEDASRTVAGYLRHHAAIDGIKRDPWKAVQRWRLDYLNDHSTPAQSVVIAGGVPHKHIRVDVSLFKEQVAFISNEISSGRWSEANARNYTDVVLTRHFAMPKKAPS